MVLSGYPEFWIIFRVPHDLLHLKYRGLPSIKPLKTRTIYFPFGAKPQYQPHVLYKLSPAIQSDLSKSLSADLSMQ
jgi:hypothetical protein